jgi:8-oxo-dGTP pyrophosphatase MutT (NUDIX family)
MLDLDASREGVPPKDAATLILVREEASGLEVFCVERAKSMRFLGGAIVFPGGKLDERERDAQWTELSTPPHARGAGFADEGVLRALAVAACRESLEEAAILPVAGASVGHEELLALRAQVEADATALARFLGERGLRLDLGALHPFARWITPAAEARRFDTRFFLASAPPGQPGAHDESETLASFWAAPQEILARFLRGEVQLAPPTHRTLEILRDAGTVAAALAAADASCLDPICPRLVPQSEPGGDTMALVLPGDPEHDVREARSPGASRYVLRGERFVPENAPRR